MRFKKFTIIVPVFNEEKSIIVLLRKLSKLQFGLKKEILVVDDGSKDKTFDLVKKYSKKNKDVKLISYKSNKGKGYAVRTGIKVSSGDILTIQDGDLEYNPLDYIKLIKPIIEGKTRVVFGSRFLNNKNKKRNAFYFGNKFLSLLTSVLYFKKITDMETCYKVMESNLIKKITLKSDGFSIEPEITAKLIKRKIDILEIPISYSPRTKKQGKKIKVIRDGFKALKTLLYYRILD